MHALLHGQAVSSSSMEKYGDKDSDSGEVTPKYTGGAIGRTESFCRAGGESGDAMRSVKNSQQIHWSRLSRTNALCWLLPPTLASESRSSQAHPSTSLTHMERPANAHDVWSCSQAAQDRPGDGAARPTGEQLRGAGAPAPAAAAAASRWGCSSCCAVVPPWPAWPSEPQLALTNRRCASPHSQERSCEQQL
jgi:hypothetical protein